MRPAHHRAPVGATLLIVGLALAGCAAAADDPAPSAPVTSAPGVSAGDGQAAAPTDDPTPTGVAAADVTCENLVTAATIDTFDEAGWTPSEAAFTIGATELEGGIRCTWSEPDVESNDLMIFGWAPIDGETATTLEAELAAGDWRLEDSADGVVLTEMNPLTADPDGYGYTYLFGDGWVTFADMKQNLVLIERPYV